MTIKQGMGRAFWICAGFTLISALIGAVFSILSLRMPAGHEAAMYAVSRSVALPLTVIYVMIVRSRGGLSALAIAMTIVQIFDAIVGFCLHEPSRSIGPIVLATVNFVLWLWLKRQSPTPALA
jgi:hypothetical protein